MSVRFRTADGEIVTLPGPLDDPEVWESLLEKIAAGQSTGAIGPVPAWLLAAAQERHPTMKLSKDTYDAIRAGGAKPLLIPETLAGAGPPEFVTDITPARFNRVVAQELEELDGFEPVLTRQYERIIRKLGRQMAARFRELAHAQALAAAFDPNQPRDPGGEGGGQWVAVSSSDEDRLIPTDDEYTQLVKGARIRVHDDEYVHERMRGLEGTLETATKDTLGVYFPNIPGVEGGMGITVQRRDADMVAHPGSPGDETTQTAMRLWRGDFSSSLALKALIEGREPAPAYRDRRTAELAEALNRGLDQAGTLSQTAFRIVPGDPPQVGSQVKFTAVAAGVDRGMVEEYRTTFLTGHEKPTVFLIPPDAKALYFPDGQEAIVRGDFTVDEVTWSEERKVWETKLRSSHSLTSAAVFREEMVRRWPTGTKVSGPAGGGRFAPKELTPTSRQSSSPDKPWERDIRHQLAEHFKKKGVFDAYGTADRIMPYGQEYMLAELKPRRTNVKFGHVTSFSADVVLLFPGSKIDVISGQEVPSAKGKMPALLEYKAPLSKTGKPLKTKTTITRRPPPAMTSAATWNPPTVAELLAMLLEDATEILAGPTATQRKIFQTTVDGILHRLGLSMEVRALIAQTILNGLAARSEAILEGIRTPVARIVANSYLNGLSVPQTAKAITEGVDGLADWQATQLARNDLVGMANGGSLLAAKMVNERFPGAAGTYKQWLATEDERTRPTHNEAHGQRVPLETPFVVGGAPLDYPGDPRGPDQEVINCRCTLIYFSEPKAVTAAFDESKVNRDPGGDKGGQFIEKGTTGADEATSEEEKPDAGATLGKPLKLKEPEGSTKKPTEKTVSRNAQAVMDDVADFYGADRKSPAMYEPEACGSWGVDARSVIPPSQMEAANPKQEVWFGLPIMDKARDPDYGVFPYRQIAHEAIHANVSGQRFTSGFYHDYEEGAAEILSINYWAERGQPFDHRDAVRVDGRWTAAGAESLAHSVVYRDQVADLMRRSASSVGWERDKVVTEVLKVVRGDSNVKLKFRDSTDPEFDPPEGVSDDAVGLIHWLISKPLTAAAREYVRYPKGTEVGPSGTGPGGGRFAPVMGEEAFAPEEIPTEEGYVGLRTLIDPLNAEWERWEDETQTLYGPVADANWQYSMIAGELVAPDDAGVTKIAVQNQIAAKLEGDEDFKSLIAKLDPIGAYKTDFEEGGKYSSADTVEKQVAALATGTWARTSGDSDEISLQFQIAAEQEFGLEANPFVHQEFEEMMADYGDAVPGAVRTPRWNESEMSGARKFLRAQYELTQERFDAAGIKEVVLYRGMAWKPGDVPAEIEGLRDTRVRQTGVVAVTGNPLSSWSKSYSVAHQFTAKYDVKAIAGTKIDVRRILSTPFTGFGCLDESEMVVLGGRDMDAMTWVWHNGYFLNDEEFLNVIPGPAYGATGQDEFVREWIEAVRKKP